MSANMTATQDIINPRQGLVYSLRSKVEQIWKIDSVYYHLKSERGSRSSQMFNNNGGLYQSSRKKDSLKHSDSSNRQLSQFNEKTPCLEQKIFLQSKSVNFSTQLQKKNPVVSQIDNSTSYHQGQTPRPPFSAINTFHPAFKRLQQIRKQLRQKMSSPQFWLKCPNTTQVKHLSQFYPVPADDLLQVISQPTNQPNKKSIILVEQERQKFANYSHQNKLAQKRRPISQIDESSVQEQHSCQNDYSIRNKLQLSQLRMFLAQMPFQHIASQALRHLGILKEFNCSRQSLNMQIQDQVKKESIQLNKKSYVKIQTKGTYQPLASVDYNLPPSQRQYLESSQNVVTLTLSQKKQILHKFNQQQKQMMKRMIQSMILSRDMQNQIRVSKSRIFSDQQAQKQGNPQSQMGQKPKEDVIIKSKRVRDVPKQRKKMIFFNQNWSTTNLKESSEWQGQLNLTLQFKKLQALMKDHSMKESLVDSAIDSSISSHSLTSIISEQLSSNIKSPKH